MSDFIGTFHYSAAGWDRNLVDQDFFQNIDPCSHSQMTPCGHSRDVLNVLVIVGSERWLCGIINEFPGQARGSGGYWTVVILPALGLSLARHAAHRSVWKLGLI